MKKLFTQKGSIHVFPLLLIVAAVGIISFLLISSTAPFQGGLFNQTNPKPDSHAATSGCGLTNPAFCETFDAPAGTGNRSGQMNGTIWGTSRTTGNIDLGQGFYNGWGPTKLVGCDGNTTTVTPPNDIIICNGQMREATNDFGTVTAITMYPKQPFDFAGRTGKVTFDVGNDAHNSHAAWPEFWITDKPVPGPFAHEDSWQSDPQYGIALRFAGYVDANGNGAACPEGSDNTSSGYKGVNSASIINNYVPNDYDNAVHSLTIHGLDCVKGPSQMGQLNHYEIDISTSQIDVYGTDAGTTAPLKHLAIIPNINLGFTRGLIWLVDAHYNANKGDLGNPAVSQREHTFVWDNVGFDGPFTYRDLSFDAPDNNKADSDGSISLGKFSDANQAATWNVPGMPANPTATAVRVMFSFSPDVIPSVFNINVNGHQHQIPWPFPYTTPSSWRPFETTIPITDLVPGTNVVTIGADQKLISSNVNIVLVDAGATPPPSPTVPPTPTPIPTPIPTPTASPLPGNTTTIDDAVTGTGTNQFNYIGAGWNHCTNCGAELYNGSNSWDNVAGNTVTFQFTGQQAAFYGIKDPSEGTGAFSIDGGAETIVTFFASTRAGNQLLYTTPVLSPGTHTLKLRVTGTTVSGGTNSYIGVDRVDVITSSGPACTPAVCPQPTSAPGQTCVTGTPPPTNCSCAGIVCSTNPPSPSPSSAPSCPKKAMGDIDCDNTIGIFDYNILVGNFNKVGTGIQGDLDNSGKVDIFDYNILVGNFGK